MSRRDQRMNYTPGKDASPKVESKMGGPQFTWHRWRCSCCDLVKSASVMDTRWRWTGSAYEHKCEGSDGYCDCTDIDHQPVEDVAHVSAATPAGHPEFYKIGDTVTEAATGYTVTVVEHENAEGQPPGAANKIVGYRVRFEDQGKAWRRPSELVPLVGKVSAATPVIEGVGKDAPLYVNKHGGKQSDSPYRADLLQAHALLHLAAIMKAGAAKYGDNNWHKIPASENINHALIHLLSHLAGDTQDDHLGHAAWRIVSALDQVKSGRDAKLKEVVK